MINQERELFERIVTSKEFNEAGVKRGWLGIAEYVFAEARANIIPDWIRVEDRLPDDTSEYSVWVLDMLIDQEYYTTSQMNPSLTGFYVDFIDDETPRQKVLFWKPLPLPPVSVPK